MRFTFLSPVLVTLVLQACISPRVQTIWKADQQPLYRYKKILVVAIMPEYDDSLRAVVEEETVRQLAGNGYQAISYRDGFSIYEISETTTQEAAYFTLCEKGIDCILTLAKVDPALTVSLKKGTRARFPAYFYFNHIWNYRQLATTTVSPNTDQIWECILFDLQSLKQQSVLQVSRLSGLQKEKEAAWIAQRIVGKMLTDSALVNKIPGKQTPLKGF
jgi:hypothetical protein